MAGIFYEQAPKLETPSEPEDASDDDGQKLLDVEQGLDPCLTPHAPMELHPDSSDVDPEGPLTLILTLTRSGDASAS